MAGALVFMWLVKPPTTASTSQNAAHAIFVQINEARNLFKKTLRQIRPKLWEGNSEMVSASVLDVLAKTTTANSVKLGAFRPQRFAAARQHHRDPVHRADHRPISGIRRRDAGSGLEGQQGGASFGSDHVFRRSDTRSNRVARSIAYIPGDAIAPGHCGCESNRGRLQAAFARRLTATGLVYRRV